jgi:predicted ester cyclase
MEVDFVILFYQNSLQAKTMETRDNKTIIRRYIEEVFNTGDVSKIHDFISEDYTEVFEGTRHKIGIQGAIDHVQGVRRVFPDLNLTIENQISEEDWIATCLRVTGTFQKEWFGMKPTGKPITFYGVDVERIRDGKIIEHGGAVNLMEPLLKAGAIQKT